MNFRAFTLKANKRLNIIKLQVGIAETLSSGAEPSKDKIFSFWGVWDSGATNSCISTNVVKKLNLEPVQSVNVHTSTGIMQRPSYIVDLFLPNNIRLTPLRASEVEPNTHIGFDCIIGMDIISQGDVSISNVGGKTMFSFRVPSMGALDFVEQHQKSKKSNNVQKVQINRTSRNKMCPCGSGKKFKNCCAT